MNSNVLRSREYVKKIKISCDLTNKKIILYLIMFIISGFLSIVFFLNTTELSFYGDQIGPFSLATFLAGNDWSDVMKAESYYGFGYYFIYFWIFRLTTDYHIIYFTIIIIDALVCASVSLIIYWFVSTKILKEWSIKGVVISFIAYSMHIYCVSVMNEKPSFAIVWLSVLVICKLLYTKNSIKWTCILALLTGYSISIHERMIILPLAIIFVSIIFRFFYKKKTINISLFCFVFCMGYLGERIIRKEVISLFYSESGALQNTTVINADMLNYASSDAVRTFFLLVVSNVYKIILSTYGVGLFAIILMVLIIKRMIDVNKQKQDFINISILGDINLDYIFCVFMVCVGATVFGLAFNQCGYVSYCFEKLVPTQQCYKAFFYYRYYSIFLGPIYVLMFTDNAKKLVNKYVVLVVSGILLLYKLIHEFIYPYIVSTNYIGVSMDFAPVYLNISQNTYQNQIINSLVSFAIVILLVFLLYGKSKKSMVFYFLIVLILIFGNVKHIGMPKIKSNEFDKIYYFMEDSFSDNRDMDVYCTFGNYRTLQFILNGNTIRFALPDYLDENDIVFTKNEIVEYSSYPSIKMDDGIIIYYNQALFDIM